MQDRPTAGELLQAAREFCERDLMPQLTGRLAFHTRVLANVLSILEREWEHEEDALRAEWTQLRDLLGEDAEEPQALATLRDEVRVRNARLARAIRTGEMDDRLPDIAGALATTIRDKLRIANPKWAQASSDT